MVFCNYLCDYFVKTYLVHLINWLRRGGHHARSSHFAKMNDLALAVTFVALPLCNIDSSKRSATVSLDWWTTKFIVARSAEYILQRIAIDKTQNSFSFINHSSHRSPIDVNRQCYEAKWNIISQNDLFDSTDTYLFGGLSLKYVNISKRVPIGCQQKVPNCRSAILLCTTVRVSKNRSQEFFWHAVTIKKAHPL